VSPASPAPTTTTRGPGLAACGWTSGAGPAHAGRPSVATAAPLSAAIRKRRWESWLEGAVVASVSRVMAAAYHTTRRRGQAGRAALGLSREQRSMACSARAMARDPQGTLLQAALGTILFVVLVPGSVVVLGPWLVTGWHIAPPLLRWHVTRWLGAALLVLAVPLFAAFNLRFVIEGHGTPAPIAPTNRLVVGGPFRCVRNPGYVSVLALLVGQALFFATPQLLAYAGVVALAFHLFVVLYEEPTLRRQFGADYETYCRAVPRWLPRLRPAAQQL
jgi:protein-S-isoprenylcysteine O-methyltransferase Ste14